MARFQKELLAQLSVQDEIAIRTEKHPDSAVVIWVAVADGEVFVRSARGAKGRWYRDLATGGEATLEFKGHALPVHAVAAADAASVERASREYLRKYRRSPYAQSVVRPDILSTTLRLEPR
jgi:hypothetical protein